MRTLLAWLVLLLAPISAAGEASRIALVIGNARYKDSPLLNPVNDARALSAALRSAGFEVIELHEQGSAGMRRAIREFGEKLRGKDAGLFYFAGHGVQVRGRNYLVPVDADIKYEDEIEDQSVEIGLVLGKMEAAKARVNLVVLDACRNNPFARSSRSGQNGLAPMDAPIGTLIAFATSPGQVASDGAQGNGLYTSHLVRTMSEPGLKVEDVFKRVRAAVRMASAGRQIPWENTSLEGDFFFRAAPPVDSAAQERERARREEQAIQAAVADALTRSREEAGREKQRLERFYNEKLEAERAAFRKEASERMAALEKSVLAAAQPQPAAVARPDPLPAMAGMATTAPPVLAAKPLAAATPAAPSPTGVATPEEEPQRLGGPEERARTNEDMPASLLLALGVDSTLRNKLRPVSEDVARGLKRSPRLVGDSFTFYRTQRDGEGVERRNYMTRTTIEVTPGGHVSTQTDSPHLARFDADGNMVAGNARNGTAPVRYDPMDPLYRFPLEPGSTWTASHKEIHPTHTVEVDATVTVGGWEDIVVPAGTFRAIRVSRVSQKRWEPFPGQRQEAKRVTSHWYVPAIGSMVKFQGLEVTAQGAVNFDQVWELDSFELK